MSDDNLDVSWKTEKEAFKHAVVQAVYIDHKKMSEAIDDILGDGDDDESWSLNGDIAEEIELAVSGSVTDTADRIYDEYAEGRDD